MLEEFMARRRFRQLYLLWGWRVFVLVSTFIATIVLLPAPFDTTPHHPPQRPTLDGAYASSPSLHYIESTLRSPIYATLIDSQFRLWSASNTGLISVTEPLSALSSKIPATSLELSAIGESIDQSQSKPLCKTTGFPWALSLDEKTEVLWIADAKRGLLRCSTNKAPNTIAEADLILQGEAERPFQMLSAVTVSQNGLVYFTEIGQHTYETWPYALADGQSSGRVYLYDPITQRLQMLYKGLRNPRGLALTQDEQHLIILESGGYALVKLDLATRMNQLQNGILNASPSTFIRPILENLPGIPTVISRYSHHNFLILMPVLRRNFYDILYDSWLGKKTLAAIPLPWWPGLYAPSVVISISDKGEINWVWHHPEEKESSTFTSLMYVSKPEMSAFLFSPFTSQFKKSSSYNFLMLSKKE
jgi:hypothetical protein